MKKINFKLVFLFVLLLLFVQGCTIDKSYEVLGFELNNNIYVYQFANYEESVDLSEVIKIKDEGASIKYYYDEGHVEEINSSVIDLFEGDNYVYCEIQYSDEKTTFITLNCYRLQLFTVKFVSNCVTKVDSVEVEENSFLDKPDVELKKVGHTFIGWDYDFNKPVTENLIIEGKWEKNTYIVEFDAKDGELEYESMSVTYGEPFKLPIPTKEGYDFLGWVYNGRYVTEETWIIDKDVTLVAVWEEETKTYEIEYIIVGAVGPNLQRTYTNKETVVLRTPYKNGSRFLGWYYESDFSGERVYELPKGTEGNITLYSKWEKFTLEGAKVSILGDSISTFYSADSDVNSSYSGSNQYYYPIYSSTVKRVEQTWWHLFLSDTKTKLLTNDSISGSSCYNWGSEANDTAAMNNARIKNLEGSDIVIVFIGTNDNVNGFTKKQFTEAYDTMLKRIKKVCPDAFVFCCTMGYSGYNQYYYTEARRLEMNDVIREVSNNNDAVVIEISNVQTKDNYQLLLGDALHPNAIGMVAYANEIIKKVKEHVGA